MMGISVFLIQHSLTVSLNTSGYHQMVAGVGYPQRTCKQRQGGIYSDLLLTSLAIQA